MMWARKDAHSPVLCPMAWEAHRDTEPRLPPCSAAQEGRKTDLWSATPPTDLPAGACVAQTGPRHLLVTMPCCAVWTEDVTQGTGSLQPVCPRSHHNVWIRGGLKEEEDKGAA